MHNKVQGSLLVNEDLSMHGSIEKTTSGERRTAPKNLSNLDHIIRLMFFLISIVKQRYDLSQRQLGIPYWGVLWEGDKTRGCKLWKERGWLGSFGIQSDMETITTAISRNVFLNSGRYMVFLCVSQMQCVVGSRNLCNCTNFFFIT